MTDFLHHLALRSLQMADSVQPRLPALFESNPYGPRAFDESMASDANRSRLPNPKATSERLIGDAAEEQASGRVSRASSQPQEPVQQRVPVAPIRDERDMSDADTDESIRSPPFPQSAASFRPNLQKIADEPSHVDAEPPPVLRDIAMRTNDRTPAERPSNSDDGSTRDRNRTWRSVERLNESQPLSQDDPVGDMTPPVIRVDKGSIKPGVVPETAYSGVESRRLLDSNESDRTHVLEQADRPAALRSVIESAAAIGRTQPSSTKIQLPREEPHADRPVIGSPVQPRLPPIPRQPTSTTKVTQTVAPEPTINITIGRIEVKATPAAPPQNKAKKKRPSTPVVGLDEYLRQQAGDGS